MDRFLQLLEFFSIPWEVQVLAAVFAFAFAIARVLVAGERRDDTLRKKAALYATGFAKRLAGYYHIALLALLRLVDRGAKDDFLARTSAGEPVAANCFRDPSPWSNGLYDVSLKLVLLYPLVFLLVSWMATGEASNSLDNFLISEQEISERWSVAYGFANALIFALLIKRPLRWSDWLFVALALSLSFFGAFMIGIAFANAVAGSIAGIVALVAAFALSGAIAGASAVAFAVAIAVVYAFALPLVFTVQIKAGFAILVAVAVALVSGVAFKYLKQAAERFDVMTSFYVAHWLIFAALILASLYLMPRPLDDIFAGDRLLIVFFGLLPLANAPLDWLSIGLTRGLLRRYGLTGGGWRVTLVSMVDIVAAAALIFPLAMITVAVIALANWAAVAGGSPPVLPIPPILEDLRAPPFDPELLWIYLILFSTLMPSVLHILCGLVGFVVASLQAMAASIGRANAFVRAGTDPDITKDRMITVVYPLGVAAAATTLIAVAYLGISHLPLTVNFADWFAHWLLATAEWTAEGMEALLPAVQTATR